MERQGQKHIFTLTVALTILIVLALYAVSFQVRQSQVAVVSTFGEPRVAIVDPGLYFKWPRPIQTVDRFDNRLHIFDGYAHETLTYGERPIVVTETVGWRIMDPQQFVRSNGSLERMTELLRPLVADAKTKVVGQYVFRNFVSANREDLQYEEMEQRIMDMVNETLLGAEEANWGIQVDLIKLKRLELPQSVTEQVFERMMAERQREVSRIRSEGDAISNAIRARADATRQAIISKAESDAEAIRGQGEVEAALYYERLNRRPELAIFLRKIRALNNPGVAEKLTLIIDPTMPPFDILTNEIELREPVQAAN